MCKNHLITFVCLYTCILVERMKINLRQERPFVCSKGSENHRVLRVKLIDLEREI